MEPDEVTLFLSETLAGRYRPNSFLASGAFSGAFVAQDEQIQTQVAAKILKLSQCGQPEARREFQDEVGMLRKLAGCDRVIELLDSGQHTVDLRHSPSGGTIAVTTDFAVLELAAGSLAELLMYGPSFAWPDRLSLYRDVVKGVHQMHLKGIVHRDIKAENGLVLDRPVVAKIADLGRAHDTNQPSRFAVEAYLQGRGDPRFAPFEFLWLQGTQDAEDQARADVFLLGSLLFEIATGVALTALVTGNPTAVMRARAALPEADREHDWLASIPKLREAARPAIETFTLTTPPAISARAGSLLQALTDPDPTSRLSRACGSRRRISDPWDLQWLLDRVDGLRRAIDPTLRKRYIASRSNAKHGRPRARK
jgi:eukaryotic-like serine/threonine-protein kinase